MTEKRVIAVSRPAADGSYHVDWHGSFRAEAEALLDAAPPNRYAGLGLRFTTAWTAGTVSATADTGTWSESRLKFPATAIDFSHVLDGKEVGVAILDRPANRGSPTPWYIVQDPKVPFAFMMPGPLQNKALRLAPGDQLDLAYRVIVHPGRWDKARLEKELKPWVAEQETAR
jgi:hypothetical protein